VCTPGALSVKRSAVPRAVSGAALAEIPHYAVITTMYSAQGAPVEGGIIGLAPFYVWPVVALALGLVGLRRRNATAMA